MTNYELPPMFSTRKKCTLPEASPATIDTPSGATAQQEMEPSPVKVAITSLVSRFQTLRVLSPEAEITR
ncbi:hypothetical protein NIES2107_23320 [Nostoc carneum NIES-2107]|nr:hypothetical protein NIES2107_23320 [Nostoc carneum NIES-2107]